MNYLNKRCVAAAALAAVAVGVAGTANAQIRDAGAKLRGEYGTSSRSASRSLYHARDYASDYRAYARDVRQSKRPVNPEVAKEHAEGIGHNIKLFQKHLVDMRKHAAGDKETLASLDVIDKHVKEAAKHQVAMAELCAKPEVDVEGSAKCCDDAFDALDKAIAEHDKLMKKLAAKMPTTK
ncbi:MAG: hypothetical protein HYX69_21240 [Planctomycetia bacterium]|nr:hypothetical protein [Planctomycetia bacterium]